MIRAKVKIRKGTVHSRFRYHGSPYDMMYEVLCLIGTARRFFTRELGDRAWDTFGAVIRKALEDPDSPVNQKNVSE